MIHVAIITVSDSTAAGRREDRSGPALEERARQAGWTVVRRAAVADEQEQIAELLKSIADSDAANVILTTGGTGIAHRDVTPEATRAVIEREIPGIAEVMRFEGRKHTPLAALSRAICGVRGRTLIINLPGSPKGAVESLDAVAGLAAHVVDLLQGRTAHDPKLDGNEGRPITV
jgi:molybdenum cofactor synthesis domain-containing protein